jgi:hypothetical protein
MDVAGVPRYGSELMEQAAGFAIAWAVLVPVWGIATAVAAWGRVQLPRAQILGATVRSLLGSAGVGFPLAWVAYWYCARFNPSPSASAVTVGGVLAGVLFPLYATVVTIVAFEFLGQASLKRGAQPRRGWVRMASGAALGLIAIGALLALGTACLFATGPKALG